MNKTIISCISTILLASCSSETVETGNIIVDGNDGGSVERVIIKSTPFVYDGNTRTSLTATDQGISFAWASYDALGVFPIEPTTNNQAKQELNLPADCESDAHYASFDGAGWALIKGNTYAAYTPYNGNLPASTPYTAVPIDMTGQDGTLATIGQKYDYMYAPSTFTEEACENGGTHEVVFDFNHAISIIQLRLTMQEPNTLKNITLTNKNGDNVWITSATLNVATGNVTPTATSSSISLDLENLYVDEDNELVIYVAALPTTTGELQLTAVTDEGAEYTASLASKTLESGKAYRYTASDFTFSADGRIDGHEYVDFITVRFATMNIGATTPWDIGNYYAWGETKAYREEDKSNLINYNYNNQQSYVKTIYSWETYKWCNETENSLTKYCTDSSFGTVDNKTVLDQEDDVAAINWGGGWHTPTIGDFMQLTRNSFWVWTSNYNNTNLSGFIVFKAKRYSDRGRIVYGGNNGSGYSLYDAHIFLPVTGYRENNQLNDADTDGYYWTKDLREPSNDKSSSLQIQSHFVSTSTDAYRIYGLCVRPVFD